MAHQTFLIGLVLVPALLLIVLVWWRFYGKGRVAPESGSGLHRFQCIPNRYYDVSDFIDPIPNAEPSEHGGIQNIIEELLEGAEPQPDSWEEDSIMGEGHLAPSWEQAKNPPGSPDQSKPVSDTPESGLFPEDGLPQETSPPPPDPSQGSPATPEEGDDAIAPSLFYNAVTAPAETENDSLNRQAVAAHRARRGAALRAKLTNQKEALGELFLGGPTVADPGDKAS
ncbi:hypothetical protein [Rufibacter tibetensis]|uniref:Uncharacterized protein n=1 Tax=Rufibacter tibetensis TaxID=512763 RepID=A0A0N7HXC5_9BACT|nr:hypothetical protein [Rufibacter tibetensis]ALJ01665.1 hypothetical protein DC20_21645 [Rufibacter tibetensis]